MVTIFLSFSPGTGRTGTVIAIALSMRQYEDCGRVDVFKTVSQLRQDRAGLVKTKEQYAFIYQVTLYDEQLFLFFIVAINADDTGREIMMIKHNPMLLVHVIQPRYKLYSAVGITNLLDWTLIVIEVPSYRQDDIYGRVTYSD